MKNAIAALVAGILVCAGPAALADETSVKKLVEEKLGAKADQVTKTPYGGLYEVYAEGQMLYTDEKVNFFIGTLTRGELVDTKTRRSVTGERLEKLSAINFSELPLNLAVKTVRGKGSRVIATFEDPNCGYCKRLAKDLQNVDDITIYTFLYPILSEDSADKTKKIWCAQDRNKAWNDWILNATAPGGDGKCEHPTDKVLALGQKLRVSGTPTIFFSNGERAGGWIPADQMEKRLKRIAAGGKPAPSAN
jgi:thiol:disulfide interchange protein DsbC